MAGVPPTRLRSAGFVRVTRGIYVPPNTDTAAPDTRLVALAERLPEGYAIGGWAAARVHEAHVRRGSGDLVVFDGVLPEMDSSARVSLPILVCAPRSKRLRPIPGAVLFRSDLGSTEVQEVLGLPVTSPLRTAFDLARLWPTTPGVVALDRLRALELVSPEALSEIVEARPSWRGAPRARRATGLSEDGVESPRESMMRLLWLGARLPRPACNPVIRDQRGGFVARVDLLDDQVGLVGEYDGAEHASATRRQRDAARQELLEDVGLCVVRANDPDIATAAGRRSWQLRLRSAHVRARMLDRPRRWTASRP